MVLPLALLAACSGSGGSLDELPPAPVADAGPQAQLPPATAGEGAPPPMEGPQGSSQLRPGEDRYDRVGYAGYAGAGEGVFALSGELQPGSFAEVTALDTGRTILVQVRGEGRGLLELSGGAAKQLGVTGNPAVRVRRVTVTPQDSALLSTGQAAPTRADAPQALLVGLRKQLAERVPAETKPAPVAAQPRPPRRAAPPAKTPAQTQPARAARGLFVQVAALSNAQRARALAGQLGGTVRSAGSLHRVQLGPFPNRTAAERARADAAKRGYGDARVISVP
ncbi:SPOR domain-containing protein [Sphingomonas sp. BT-65]|uniref:SPOR domain-containing protein n=1 Tax=Sphingomonas sp. BT-65 TaxID=2989821 RepID=UPI00223685E7|nr:SPOR domain-containing protein [Sphingomonas sp. BT-65]MCW4460459.1 SPOR domain-containing protein [Sphingomonas sp. BT-65]